MHYGFLTHYTLLTGAGGDQSNRSGKGAETSFFQFSRSGSEDSLMCNIDVILKV